jgi:small subunit ribosomal protein S1
VKLPYVYRVTKYDPADRDEHGYYTASEDTLSDHGVVEAAYLQAVAALAEDTGVDHLAVREPQIPSFAHFGAAPSVEGYGPGRALARRPGWFLRRVTGTAGCRAGVGTGHAA